MAQIDVPIIQRRPSETAFSDSTSIRPTISRSIVHSSIDESCVNATGVASAASRRVSRQLSVETPEDIRENYRGGAEFAHVRCRLLNGRRWA